MVPGRAIITSSRKALVQRKSYREFIRRSAEVFGRNAASAFDTTQSNNNDPFNNNNNNDPFGNGNNMFGMSTTTTTTTRNPFGDPFGTTSFSVFGQTTQFDQTTSSTTRKPTNFRIFESQRYNGRDLLFMDYTAQFKDLDDRTTYVSFLRECFILSSLYVSLIDMISLSF